MASLETKQEAGSDLDVYAEQGRQWVNNRTVFKPHARYYSEMKMLHVYLEDSSVRVESRNSPWEVINCLEGMYASHDTQGGLPGRIVGLQIYMGRVIPGKNATVKTCVDRLKQLGYRYLDNIPMDIWQNITSLRISKK